MTISYVSVLAPGLRGPDMFVLMQMTSIWIQPSERQYEIAHHNFDNQNPIPAINRQTWATTNVTIKPIIT